MEVTLCEKIKACYLAYINEKNLYKKIYYFDLLKSYLAEEEDINNGK